jgi:pimeloyl-ACP methyl ester carboxylesterase
MLVTSADGTTIEYTVRGRGPSVVLVGGGLDDGRENEPLATFLADAFTVYNYARRGRAGSGDTAPYAVDREHDDLAALIDATLRTLAGAGHVPPPELIGPVLRDFFTPRD